MTAPESMPGTLQSANESGPPEARHLDRRTFLRRAALPVAVAAGAAILGRSTPSIAAPGSTRVAMRQGAADGKTVQMWSQAYGDAQAFGAFIDETVAAFKAQSGISVEWDVIPWASALQKWDLAMSNGDVPDVADVFYLQSRVVQGRGEWGPLDLTAEITAGTFGDFNRFVPVGQQEAKYLDKIYGIPWRIDIRAFVRNTDLWPTEPKDLTEFEAMGKEALTKGARAAAQPFGQGSHVVTQLGAAWDVRVLSPDFQNSNLMDERWVEAFTWAQRMVDERLFLTEAVLEAGFPPYDALLNGTVAAHFGGNDAVRAVAQGTAPQMVEKLQSSLMPAGPAGKRQSIASTAHFVVFENTAVRDESLAWLTYLTSSEVAAKLSVASGQDSPDTTVQAAAADPFVAAFYEQSTQAFTIDDPTPAWTELSAPPEGPLSQLPVKIWSGEDVRESLTTAHEQVEEILSRNRT